MRLRLLALLLVPAPALALTPQELWATWQAQAAGCGVTLGAEAVEGADGSLTLTGFAATQGGGAPATLPPEFPIQAVTLRPEGEDAVLIDLGLPPEGLRQSDETGDLLVQPANLRILARDGGEGEGSGAYEATADNLRVGALMGPSSDALGGDVAFEVSGLELRFPGQAGPDLTVEASLAVDGYAYVFSSPDPFTGQATSQSARGLGDLGLTATVTLPQGMTLQEITDASAFARALQGGLGARIEATSGTFSQESWVRGLPFDYEIRVTAEPGTYEMALDGREVSVVAQYGAASYSVTSPALPFPQLDLGFGEIEADVRAPLGPEGGEFRYFLSLRDVTANEEAWAALDPQGLLPRDPARLSVDVGGRMTLDLLALLAASETGGVPPAPVLETVEVRTFDLAVAGVEASASGSMEFDNASGTPVPTTGSGTARVAGLDRLIDALVGAGWITAEDARNARLGLAAAFRPGDAPDTRQATVELRPDGSVWANGVQLQ